MFQQNHTLKLKKNNLSRTIPNSYADISTISTISSYQCCSKRCTSSDLLSLDWIKQFWLELNAAAGTQGRRLLWINELERVKSLR